MDKKLISTTAFVVVFCCHFVTTEIPPINDKSKETASSDVNVTVSTTEIPLTSTNITQLSNSTGTINIPLSINNNVDESDNCTKPCSPMIHQHVVVAASPLSIIELIEAAAIMKAFDQSLMIPFLHDMERSEYKRETADVTVLPGKSITNDKAKKTKESIVSAGDKPIGENVTIPVTTMSTEIEQKPVEENNASKSVTKVSQEKSTSTVMTIVGGHTSVDDKENVKDEDLDDKPEGAREDRELKREVAIHSEPLDKIEEKLNKGKLDRDVVEEVLGSILGETKRDEILTPQISKKKRSISPEKFVKTNVSVGDLKKMLLGSKPGNKKKVNKIKRSTAYGMYMGSGNNGNIPIISGTQFPELLVPTSSPQQTAFRTMSSVSYGSDINDSDSPANEDTELPTRSSQTFKYAVRRRPLVRNSVKSASSYGERKSADFPSNYKDSSNSDIPASRASHYDHPATRPMNRSSKYITDLSDLPISHDFPIVHGDHSDEAMIDTQFRKNEETSRAREFQKVRIIYEYETPMHMSSGSSSGINDEIQDTRSTHYVVPDDTPFPSPINSDTRNGVRMPLPPLAAPNRISYHVSTTRSDTGRYKRSTQSKEVSKRRIPMILSAVSRFTRNGPI